MPITATSTTTIIALSVNQDHALLLTISPWLIALIIFIFTSTLFLRWIMGKWHGPSFEIDKADVGLGSGTISFKPNRKDQQIAYSIWVELSTRKIGLPIDLGHDVIWEIYDSWYNFFSITRKLIKDIPISKVKNKSTQKIISLSVDVLNAGLRPHLTLWQARFRHWYKKELDKATGDIDPQSIQAKYPKFGELQKDLLAVNQRLIKYRDKMRELVLGLPDKS